MSDPTIKPKSNVRRNLALVAIGFVALLSLGRFSLTWLSNTVERLADEQREATETAETAETERPESNSSMDEAVSDFKATLDTIDGIDDLIQVGRTVSPEKDWVNLYVTPGWNGLPYQSRYDAVEDFGALWRQIYPGGHLMLYSGSTQVGSVVSPTVGAGDPVVKVQE